jgi:hypothetical protein
MILYSWKNLPIGVHRIAIINLLCDKCNEAVNELLVAVIQLFENNSSGRVVRELESGDVTATKSNDVSDVIDVVPEKRLAYRRISPLAKDIGHDEIEIGNGSGSHGASSRGKTLFKTVEMQFDTRKTATVMLICEFLEELPRLD